MTDVEHNGRTYKIIFDSYLQVHKLVVKSSTKRWNTLRIYTKAVYAKVLSYNKGDYSKAVLYLLKKYCEAKQKRRV